MLKKCDLYALESDLYGLNPYKGDTHVHTDVSDENALSEARREVARFKKNFFGK